MLDEEVHVVHVFEVFIAIVFALGAVALTYYALSPKELALSASASKEK